MVSRIVAIPVSCQPTLLVAIVPCRGREGEGATMLSIAVIGAGRIGSIHARNIAAHDGARLAGVADVDAAAAARPGPQYRACAVSLDEAFAADAVLIGSPTPTHADYIERAAAAGRAVFCEKPIDLSAARVRSCLDAVRKAGTPLMVGFNRRFARISGPLQGRPPGGEIARLNLRPIPSRAPSPPPPAYVAQSGG